MSIEAPRPRDYGFGFTETERDFYRVSDKRFQELFTDEQTTIHKIELSYNSFGEFLFVTASRETPEGRQPVTFYSQGYHEYRERWIDNEWYWYRANSHLATLKRIVAKDEAEEVLNQRREEIAPYITQAQQTRRGQLYEMMADLTDEDGAIMEMEDLADWLLDGLE